MQFTIVSILAFAAFAAAKPAAPQQTGSTGVKCEPVEYYESQEVCDEKCEGTGSATPLCMNTGIDGETPFVCLNCTQE